MNEVSLLGKLALNQSKQEWRRLPISQIAAGQELHSTGPGKNKILRLIYFLVWK